MAVVTAHENMHPLWQSIIALDWSFPQPELDIDLLIKIYKITMADTPTYQRSRYSRSASLQRLGFCNGQLCLY